jgi:hypothetical protein
LSNLGRTSTCWMSFSKVSLMKDDFNDEVPDGTPKTLNFFYGVLNWNEVSKLRGKLKRDHATHFLGWLKRSIPRNSIWKFSYAKDTMEGGPMMWMSYEMDGNRK